MLRSNSPLAKRPRSLGCARRVPHPVRSGTRGQSSRAGLRSRGRANNTSSTCSTSQPAPTPSRP